MDETGSVLLELERLRGAVNEGFATINGRLDSQLQRTDTAEKDIEKLEARVSTLEKKVWAASGLAAVLSGGGVAGVLALLGR